mmetsp:Transcript_29489/g.67839  ORF Transcript_29489/g.67839 Transcript_29489/m.67839 type:complete len:80 (+) Transcript_29489:557-796(+)
MEIARAAGVSDQSGDGVEPMGAFEAEEDGDIDVSMVWEDGKGPRFDVDEDSFDEDSFDFDTSITRMDGSIDVAGRSGQW